MGKKSFFSIIFAILGLAASGFIAYFALKENQRNKQIENEINVLREEAQKIRQSNQEMEEKILYYDTEEYQEKVAKEKLNLQKENENVAIIKPTPSPKEMAGDESNAPLEQKKTKEKPTYQKWIDYFIKY